MRTASCRSLFLLASGPLYLAEATMGPLPLSINFFGEGEILSAGSAQRSLAKPASFAGIILLSLEVSALQLLLMHNAASFQPRDPPAALALQV
jgi:hypothetical protein